MERGRHGAEGRDYINGKRKGENGKLRVSESRSMVGTQRAASEKRTKRTLTQSPNVAMGIATLTKHRLTFPSIFQGPRSPYRSPPYRSPLTVYLCTLYSALCTLYSVL